MAATYTQIETQTLTGNQTTITFNSFSGYTDLRLIVNPLSTADGMNYMLRFNNDSSTNYSLTYMRGNGSTAVSNRQSNGTFFDNLNMGVYTTNPHLYIYEILDYSNTTTYKTVLARFAEMSGTGFTASSACTWRKTPEAITTITLTALTNQFASGSVFSLYGMKAA